MVLEQMICRTCGMKTDIHLIDCTLTGVERDTTFCPGCRQTWRSEMNGRRFVVDRRETYPLEERLKDVRKWVM
jgi:hypothetical protein